MSSMETKSSLMSPPDPKNGEEAEKQPERGADEWSYVVEKGDNERHDIILRKQAEGTNNRLNKPLQAGLVEEVDNFIVDRLEEHADKESPRSSKSSFFDREIGKIAEEAGTETDEENHYVNLINDLSGSEGHEVKSLNEVWLETEQLRGAEKVKQLKAIRAFSLALNELQPSHKTNKEWTKLNDEQKELVRVAEITKLRVDVEMAKVVYSNKRLTDEQKVQHAEELGEVLEDYASGEDIPEGIRIEFETAADQADSFIENKKDTKTSTPETKKAEVLKEPPSSTPPDKGPDTKPQGTRDVLTDYAAGDDIPENVQIRFKAAAAQADSIIESKKDTAKDPKTPAPKIEKKPSLIPPRAEKQSAEEIEKMLDDGLLPDEVMDGFDTIIDKLAKTNAKGVTPSNLQEYRLEDRLAEIGDQMNDGASVTSILQKAVEKKDIQRIEDLEEAGRLMAEHAGSTEKTKQFGEALQSIAQAQRVLMRDEQSPTEINKVDEETPASDIEEKEPQKPAPKLVVAKRLLVEEKPAPETTPRQEKLKENLPQMGKQFRELMSKGKSFEAAQLLANMKRMGVGFKSEGTEEEIQGRENVKKDLVKGYEAVKQEGLKKDDGGLAAARYLTYLKYTGALKSASEERQRKMREDVKNNLAEAAESKKDNIDWSLYAMHAKYTGAIEEVTDQQQERLDAQKKNIPESNTDKTVINEARLKFINKSYEPAVAVEEVRARLVEHKKKEDYSAYAKLASAYTKNINDTEKLVPYNVKILLRRHLEVSQDKAKEKKDWNNFLVDAANVDSAVGVGRKSSEKDNISPALDEAAPAAELLDVTERNKNIAADEGDRASVFESKSDETGESGKDTISGEAEEETVVEKKQMMEAVSKTSPEQSISIWTDNTKKIKLLRDGADFHEVVNEQYMTETLQKYRVEDPKREAARQRYLGLDLLRNEFGLVQIAEKPSLLDKVISLPLEKMKTRVTLAPVTGKLGAIWGSKKSKERVLLARKDAVNTMRQTAEDNEVDEKMSAFLQRLATEIELLNVSKPTKIMEKPVTAEVVESKDTEASKNSRDAETAAKKKKEAKKTRDAIKKMQELEKRKQEKKN